MKTSKYTFISFLPVNLFQQFTRMANLYFLFIAGLQLIPGLSPTSWGTTIAPLSFVLALNAIKEGFEDFKRHTSDKEVTYFNKHWSMVGESWNNFDHRL